MKQLLSLAAILLMVACSGPKSSETAESDKPSLMTQVMAAHDEVMPKMGELRAASNKLKALADSLVATDSAQAAYYMGLSEKISTANQSMMDWMHQFNPAFSGTAEEVDAYLTEQLKIIEQVKTDMLTSLDEGEKALVE